VPEPVPHLEEAIAQVHGQRAQQRGHAEQREAVLPPDLAAGLADTPRALAIFNTLTVALRRQIVQYVEIAKQGRTREKRVALIVQRMLERAAKRRKLRSRKSGKTPKKGSKQKRGRNNSHRKMPQRKQM